MTRHQATARTARTSSLPSALLLAIFLIGSNGIAHADEPSATESARMEMVERQIENRGVRDPEVLRAMRDVKRHLFVPDRVTGHAYDDRPLPIGYGQTISQPYIVAFMTEVIEPKPDFRVLEIGAGSGYQAAVLAEIVDHVYTVEIVPELAEWAESRLQLAGYENVSVKHADGYHGWEEHAPFDAIVVTAASPHIPPPLIEQLKDGGRMIIPVGSPFRTQQLVLVEKRGERTRTRNILPVQFVPFTRAEED
ncbi:MAG: protein-L-isoaspartate(D-aspartate) O-methyltransferase [Opitutales bacterium]|nr:protein-L-isoaspartate(D-aspartate) O-methyltransferase [Opitutales bacterium]